MSNSKKRPLTWLSARHLITRMGHIILTRLDLAPMEEYRDARLRTGYRARRARLKVITVSNRQTSVPPST